MPEIFLCSNCGREHPFSQRITFGGKELEFISQKAAIDTTTPTESSS